MTRALSRFLLSFCSVLNLKGQRDNKEFKQETETAAYLARIAPTCWRRTRFASYAHVSQALPGSNWKRKSYRRQLMKRLIVVAITLLLCFSAFSEEIITTKDGRTIILFDDHTWAEKENTSPNIVELYKSQLRKNIKATDQEILVACEMLAQGWKYTMPSPKSAKAAWGVSDGRTTWWYGYWYNAKTKAYSATTPKKTESGVYLGDNQNNVGSWRNGGSPARPDVYMFLLSEHGGPSF